jgi:hypothetical protein
MLATSIHNNININMNPSTSDNITVSANNITTTNTIITADTVVTAAVVATKATNSNRTVTVAEAANAIEHPYKLKLLQHIRTHKIADEINNHLKQQAQQQATTELEITNKILDEQLPSRTILVGALVDLTTMDEDKMINENKQREKNELSNKKRKMAVTSSNQATEASNTNKKARNKISQATKLKVLELKSQGMTYEAIAKQLKLKSQNSVKSIVKNQQNILRQVNPNESEVNANQTFRLREGKLPHLEKMLVQWIAIQRSKQPPLPITYDIVVSKADEFRSHVLSYLTQTIEYKAKEEQFSYLIRNYKAAKFSQGWVHAFLQRNRLGSFVMHGEGGSAPAATIEAGRADLQNELANYKLSDIYNIDELALFYGILPTRTIDFLKRKSTARGLKRDKRRVTAVLCCNADGSDKIMPLIIGRAIKPKSFVGINMANLPCKYTNSPKAWMNFSIFQKTLHDLSIRIYQSDPNRKIILLIDNAGSHIGVENLSFSNLKIKCLPPNCTSHLQPLDAGIIRATKARYRNQLLRHILNRYDLNELYAKPTVLDAIRFFAAAWKQVAIQTIKNCWRHTNILSKAQNDLLKDEVDETKVQNEEQRIIEEVKNTVQNLILNTETKTSEGIIDYITIDDNEPTENEVTAQMLALHILNNSGVETARNNDSSESDSDAQIIEPPDKPEPISKAQILDACNTISTYLLRVPSPGNGSVPMDQLQDIVEFIERMQEKALVQKNITSYFSINSVQ